MLLEVTSGAFAEPITFEIDEDPKWSEEDRERRVRLWSDCFDGFYCKSIWDELAERVGPLLGLNPKTTFPSTGIIFLTIADAKCEECANRMYCALIKIGDDDLYYPDIDIKFKER